ncbi:helix-turn-helix domain-containing protein [Candidatus Woesearchaeota archaeon]|nr:helix-turn-helix domain-containing protein [Candidatus Woesearchaeota archaeon]
MSLKMVNKAWDVKGLTPTEKLILIRLADNADENGICYPSIDYIALNCEVSTKTVTRATTTFEKLGYISKKRRQNQSIVYTLFPDFSEETKSPIQINKGHECPLGTDISVTLDGTQLCPSNLHLISTLIEEKREEFLNYMCEQKGVRNKISYRNKLIKGLNSRDEQTLENFNMYLKLIEDKEPKNEPTNKAAERLNNLKNLLNYLSANEMLNMDLTSDYPAELDAHTIDYVIAKGGLRAIRQSIVYDEASHPWHLSQLGGAA